MLEEEVNANPAEALRRCEQIEQLVPGRLGTADCIRRNRARLTTRAPGLPDRHAMDTAPFLLRALRPSS